MGSRNRELSGERRRRLRASKKRTFVHETLESRLLLTANLIVPPADTGDTLAAAQELTLESGDQVQAVEFIGNNEFGPSDVDMYVVALEQGDRLRASTTNVEFFGAVPARPGSFILRLFDLSGKELAVSDPIATPAANVVLPPTWLHFDAPQDGKYFVGVSGFPNFAYDPLVAGSGAGLFVGGYQLLMGRRPIASDDLGDTLADAKPVLLEPGGGSTRLEEVLGNNPFGPSDVDMVRMDLRRGDTISATVSSIVPIPANVALGAAVLRVFDAAGNQLAVPSSPSPGAGPLPPGVPPIFLNVSLDFIVPEDGAYFFAISSFPNFDYDPMVAGSGKGEDFGHYVFGLRRGRVNSSDAGDTLETAKSLRLGPDRGARVEEVVGNNDFGPADVDLYRMELRGGDRLVARAFGTPVTVPNGAPMIPVLRAFDSTGKEIALGVEQPRPAVVGVAPEVLLEAVIPADGSYYVGVSSFPNSAYDPHRANSGVGGQTGKYLLGVEVDRHTPKHDVGDTIRTARGLPLEPNGHVHIDEFLGDSRFGASDVDMYQLKLRTGDAIAAHLFGEFVPPVGIGPFAPHGVLRVFDAVGNELAVSDRVVQLPPGAPPLSDVFVDFVAPEDGVYYLGISTSPNFTYDPNQAGSGVGAGVGHYLLNLHLDRTNLPNDVGDILAAAKEVAVDAAGIAHVTEFIGNNQFGPNDVDLYSIEVKQGDVLAATLSHPLLDAAGLFVPGLVNGVLRAFDAAGNQLAISDGTVPPAGADFSNIAIRLTAPADGRIYVGVSSSPNTGYDPLLAGSGIGEGTGFYLMDLRLHRVAGGDDVGDTLALAEQLEINPGHRLHVDEVLGNNPYGPSDVDMYAVRLRAGDVFQAHIVGGLLPTPEVIEPFLNTVLRAFDAEGNQLATTIVLPDGTTGIPRPFAALEFEAPADGSYYLGVSSFPNVGYDPKVAGSGAGHSVGRYFLGVDIRRITPTRDVGDSLSDAETIDLGPNSRASVTEAIGNNAFGGGDVDMYRVKLAQGDNLNLMLRHPLLATGRIALEGLLRIFNAAGIELAVSRAGTGFNNVVLAFRAPVEGEYFVGVSSLQNLTYDPFLPGSGSGESRGPYKLELAVNRAQVDPDEGVPANRVRHRAPRRWAAALRAMDKQAVGGGARRGATAARAAMQSVAPLPSEASASNRVVDRWFEGLELEEEDLIHSLANDTVSDEKD